MSGKKFIIKALLIVIVLLISTSTFATAETDKPIYQVVYNSEDVYFVEDLERFREIEHPTVAVALGGGGARALVNIGVLQALEEEMIPVDLVVGTSMGAIVAVLYGSGMSTDQIKELVTKVNLPQMFNLNFPFYKSLLNTREFNQFLEKISGGLDLKDMPIPTALLSFDLTHGVKYIHTTGEISSAVQGPYAIPICFQGQQLGDFFLVDAGMTELTPAGAAKALGADFVIATTAYDELPYTRYDSSIRSTIRLINLIKEEYARRVVDANSDVIIAHDVGDYSFMDFHLASQFIQLGYLETKKIIPQIKAELENRHIALRKPVTKTEIEMEPLLVDLANDRMVLDDFVWKPLFYYGKDHSGFNQSRLQPDCFTPQYGLELGKSHWRTLLITEGTKLDNLEIGVEFKKLTSEIDLIGRVGIDKDELVWEGGFTYYGANYSLFSGLAHLSRANYLHLKGSHQIDLKAFTWTGETDLYYPLITSDSKSVKIAAYQELTYPLSERFDLQSKVLYHNTDILDIPLIYRGLEGNTAGVVQASVESVYNYDFSYSKEILQSILLTGFECTQFIDYQSAGLWAVGVGGSVNFKILGLKPSRFSGYLAYDLHANQPKLDLSIDFSF